MALPVYMSVTLLFQVTREGGKLSTHTWQMGRYNDTHHTKLTWAINLLSSSRLPMHRIIDLEDHFVRYPQRAYSTLKIHSVSKKIGV